MIFLFQMKKFNYHLNEKLLSLLTFFLEELYSNKESMTFIEFYDKIEPLFSNYFLINFFFQNKNSNKKNFS